MNNDQITVESIRIENVFGVRELEFSPGGVSIIQGDNDTGKTSVLRAISQLLGGGHDPQALRKEADKGEVRFVLDDGTEVYARLTENDTYYRVDGRDDVTARQLLQSIQDEISVNPISILQARPQDRGQILLEAIPMRVKENSLSGALSPLKGKVNVTPPAQISSEDRHALEVLGDSGSGLIGDLYEQRQELHGAKRDKQGTVSDLEQSVEQHDDPETLRKTRERITSEVQETQSQKEGAIDQVDEWEQKEVERIREEAKEKRKELRENYQPQIKSLEAERERISEKIEQAEKAEQTKEIIDERREELSELEDRYDRLSEAIENLRDLRTDFADDLPAGVQIDDDGEILDEDGIRFEHWNEQSKVHFAMQIAEMRRGSLGLIPLDGIENVVGDQRKALLEFCSQSDAQFILTEAVEGENLSVTYPNGGV